MNKYESMIDNYINGNISDFKNQVASLSNRELLEFNGLAMAHNISLIKYVIDDTEPKQKMDIHRNNDRELTALFENVEVYNREYRIALKTGNLRGLLNYVHDNFIFRHAQILDFVETFNIHHRESAGDDRPFDLRPKNYHIITAHFLGATEHLPARVILISQRFKQRVTANLTRIDGDWSNLTEKALIWLQNHGFNVIGQGEGKPGETHFITTTFEPLRGE
jgi:hypothetical protein